MTSNQIAYWSMKAQNRQIDESKRHNLATEGETGRHNRATEQVDISQLAEQSRHNVVSEKETNRHNVASENEINRHNLTTEKQGQQQIDESRRHNIESERQNILGLQETSRHNKVSENISISDLAERGRHNLATESEANRHNVASEQETARTNHANEYIRRAANDIQSRVADYNYQLGLGNLNVNETKALADRMNALVNQDYVKAQINHFNTQDAQQWQKLSQDQSIALKNMETSLERGDRENATKWAKVISDGLSSMLPIVLGLAMG